MAARPVAEGEIRWLRVRVRKVYADAGIATVRLVTPGSAGGPGYAQAAVPLEALGPPADEPLDEVLAPRLNWR